MDKGRLSSARFFSPHNIVFIGEMDVSVNNSNDKDNVLGNKL